ncbi:unnamed protein product [Amoebophrya sp. A120]|nr:unnamed protein product [Amoebophrya sp. A120]|eukprot:GSA120T00022956001.1
MHFSRFVCQKSLLLLRSRGQLRSNRADLLSGPQRMAALVGGKTRHFAARGPSLGAGAQRCSARNIRSSKLRPLPRQVPHADDHGPLPWNVRQQLSSEDAVATHADAHSFSRSDVATKFVLDADLKDVGGKRENPGKSGSDVGVRLRDGGGVTLDTLHPYTDFSGNRFPTLSTARNWRYLQPKGLNKLTPRKFPIYVESHLKLDPYFREYLFFLHTWDPVRFTIPRISERYRLKEKTVERVVEDFGENYFLRTCGLSSTRRKQIDRAARMAEKKAQAYAVSVGWDQMGDGDDAVHELAEDFRGWKSTQDWVRRQNVEVEMMSAFPSRDRRNPMPKRVDVDLVVGQTPDVKVINWIDPYDKVPF